MKKFGLIIIGCFVLLTALVSCRGAKPTVSDQNITEKTKTIVETLHDTVFLTEKDSSSYKALLDCINGKVVVKEVTHAESGRNLKSPKVRLQGNALSVDCEAKAQELFAFWKSKQVVDKEYITIKKTVTITINKLTFWQKLQIYGFRIFAVLLAIYCAWSYIKFKTGYGKYF